MVKKNVQNNLIEAINRIELENSPQRSYANGFSVTIKPGELQLVPIWDDIPTSFITVQLSVAKSLHNALGQALTKYEGIYGNEILDMKEMTDKFTNSLKPPTEENNDK